MTSNDDNDPGGEQLGDKDLGDKDLGDKDLGDKDLGDKDLGDKDLGDLLGPFGVDAEDAPRFDADAFVDVRAQINADLEQRQGPWRRMSWAARAWPIGLAAFLGLGFAFVLAPKLLVGGTVLSGAGLASCLLAGVTASLAFVSVLLSPTGPAVGERFALSAVVCGIAALGVQLYSGVGGSASLMSALPKSFGCGGILVVGAAVPLLLLVWAVRRSGLPLRALHAAGLVAAAFALGSLGVFRFCAPQETWHTLVGHLLVPVAGTAAVAALLYRVLPSRARRP